ncbi:hypothetical protein, partial [Commensalibacter nepenthis]
ANSPTIVTSTPWLNPDGSLIGQPGSGAIREVSGNADPNQAAWDFVQKVIGGKEVESVRDLEIKNTEGSKIITLKDGTVVTYRPAGAAGHRTDSSIATVEVKNDEAKKSNNGRQLKIKFKQ